MEEIDFVITYVNADDEEWNRSRERYSKEGLCDDGIVRYRDWGLLKYWFRGVEKFAPWVKKIHLVMSGKVPDWVDVKNPRLHVVYHEDYIPKECLPTFNSNVIEMFFDRIEGLSEHFVYFNDDFFLHDKVSANFFFKNGKPCDMLAFQPVVANPENPVMSHIYLNNSLVLSKYFNKRKEVFAHPGRYFKIGYPPLYFFYNLLEMAFPLYTGFFTAHGAMPFCKASFRELWEKESDYFSEVSLNRFRSERDISPYLFREWQKLTGNFAPCNITRSFHYYGVSDRRLTKEIRDGKAKIICINDENIENWKERKAEIIDAFEEILPKQSSFEIPLGG